MQIQLLDPIDDAAVAGVVALLEAAREVDAPEHPRTVEESFRAGCRARHPGLDTTRWTATAHGVVVGSLAITLFTDDNPHLATAELIVHPAHRRHGHGSALLQHCIDFAAANGRNTVVLRTLTSWPDGPSRSAAGVKFLERNGFALSFTNVRNRCRVDALVSSAEARLWDQAVAASGTGYELRSWTGPAPADLIESLCRLEALRRSEIPMGDLELEAENIDIGRARAKEAALAATHRVPVKTAAVQVTTGQVAALTDIRAYESPTAEHAAQDLTIVAPTHRGHRLGLLVKLANLRQLRQRFPRIREIWAENADVNKHMIAINTALGYESIDAVRVYQRKL